MQLHITINTASHKIYSAFSKKYNDVSPFMPNFSSMFHLNEFGLTRYMLKLVLEVANDPSKAST